MRMKEIHAIFFFSLFSFLFFPRISPEVLQIIEVFDENL